MNSCKCGTKLSDSFSRSKFGGTPHQESEDMIRELEGTRKVQGRDMVKTQTQQMCRSQGIDRQLVGLEHLHGSSLEPLDNFFQVMDLFLKPGKHPN